MRGHVCESMARHAHEGMGMGEHACKGMTWPGVHARVWAAGEVGEGKS